MREAAAAFQSLETNLPVLASRRSRAFTPTSFEPPGRFASPGYLSLRRPPMNTTTRNPSPSPSPLSRRIAACVQACEGIPTDRLEDGVIVRLVAACVHVADERVREVLEELSPRRTALRAAGGD
jgi:hypothetical protein